MLRAYTNTKIDKQYFFEGFNDKQTLGLVGIKCVE